MRTHESKRTDVENSEQRHVHSGLYFAHVGKGTFIYAFWNIGISCLNIAISSPVDNPAGLHINNL